MKRHGMYDTRIYGIWAGMMARCYRKSHNRYYRYGGRGISVCPEWHDFVNFYADMGATYADDMSIDRIDVDDDYCPENCRWIPMNRQARNKSNSAYVNTRFGRITVAELSERTGIKQTTINMRRKRGWAESELDLPIGSIRHKKDKSQKGGVRIADGYERLGHCAALPAGQG